METANDPSDMPTDPKLEHMYRRGYVYGFLGLLDALQSKLTAEEYSKTNHWIENELFKWSTTNLTKAERPPPVPSLSTNAL